MKPGLKKTLSAIVTLSCDCQCRHCYIDSQPKGTTKELSIATWCNVVSSFRNMGGELFDVHGGEPLLYEGIAQLVEYASSIGLRTSIITNAIHLDDRIKTALATCSTYVLISLDGPKGNYQSIRGINNLDVVIRNIDQLLETGVRVHPIHVVHKKNVKDISWIVEFCLSKDIPVATLSPIMPLGRARALDGFLLSPQDLTLFIERLDELNQSYKNRVKFVTQSLFRPEDEDRYLSEEWALKHYGDQYYFALNDGSLTESFDLPNPRDFILGSISDLGIIDEKVHQRFEDILDRAFLRGLRELESGNALNWDEILQREILAEA